MQSAKMGKDAFKFAIDHKFYNLNNLKFKILNKKKTFNSIPNNRLSKIKIKANNNNL